MPEPIHYQGLLFRTLNPVHARTPLSGEGAKLYGGRFNPRGTAALYTALTPETAIKEANQVGHLQPTTLVAYEADVPLIFNAGCESALADYGMAIADLTADNWRTMMLDNGIAPTQAFAQHLLNDGYRGMMIRSFARGAVLTDMNLVLWTWQDNGRSMLTLIDDEKRLS